MHYHGRFAKYKVVEGYELRPGILVMPKYAGDGQVCEIVIQKEHYAGGVTNLYSTIPHNEILKIIDELVPASERGPSLKTLGQEYISLTYGNRPNPAVVAYPPKPALPTHRVDG